MDKSLSKLKDAYKHLEVTHNKLGDYGACDTEPLLHTEKLIAGYLEGKDFEAQTADQFELYTSKKCGNAVRQLNAAHSRIHKALSEVPLNKIAEVKKFFSSKFWYVSFEGV